MNFTEGMARVGLSIGETGYLVSSSSTLHPSKYQDQTNYQVIEKKKQYRQTGRYERIEKLILD
jgi:hypothetical protein